MSLLKSNKFIQELHLNEINRRGKTRKNTLHNFEHEKNARKPKIRFSTERIKGTEIRGCTLILLNRWTISRVVKLVRLNILRHGTRRGGRPYLHWKDGVNQDYTNIGDEWRQKLWQASTTVVASIMMMMMKFKSCFARCLIV